MSDTGKNENTGDLTPKKGDPEVGFIVLAFNNALAADDALKAMETAKKQHRFYFENAAVIKQDANGNVHYRETGDMPKGGGAGVGALIGGTLGILGGPVGVAIGAGAGAAVGASLAGNDKGFKDENLKKVGIALRPGSSAVAVITSNSFLKAVHKQVPETDVRKFVNSLAKEISTRLDSGKNFALGILVTEQGLAFDELAADENSSQVVEVLVANKALVADTAALTNEEVKSEETDKKKDQSASA